MLLKNNNNIIPRIDLQLFWHGRWNIHTRVIKRNITEICKMVYDSIDTSIASTLEKTEDASYFISSRQASSSRLYFWRDASRASSFSVSGLAPSSFIAMVIRWWHTLFLF